MFYCPGKYCSKKDTCLHHRLEDSEITLQLLDMSTEGCGYGGVDENGNPFSHHEYYCGDHAPSYHSYWIMETWQDKCDFENYHYPAHAEGWPCPPGSLILIKDENGEEKIIPFEPRTMKLNTKVIKWR